MSPAMQLLSPAGLVVSTDLLGLVDWPTSKDCCGIGRSGGAALELLGGISTDCRGMGRSGGRILDGGSYGAGGAVTGGER